MLFTDPEFFTADRPTGWVNPRPNVIIIGTADPKDN